MTLHRTPGSVEAVLLQAIDIFTDADIRLLCKSRGHLYRLANPANKTRLSFEDAARIDAILTLKGQPAKFLSLFSDLIAVFGSAPLELQTDITVSLRKLAIEAGELNKAVDDGMADGNLDLNERRVIAKEAQDVIDKATEIRDAAEPPQVVNKA